MITGILAQIRIYLPWTPVPITLQSLGVLLSPLVLGWIWGAISQFFYFSLGILGIPCHRILVLLLLWRLREEKTRGLYSKIRITLMKP